MTDHIAYPMTEVGATVRLQFNQQFTFADAVKLIDYFSKLGVTHLYASPILTARQNSTHGYDIVNPTQVNAQLGGVQGLRQLVHALRRHNMGLMIDIVPNHMGVGGHENPWWQHVLEWGRSSPYAYWFDIDWCSPDPQLSNKLLAPFLGDPYGVVLEKGEITLAFNLTDNRIEARYYSHHFPIALANYREILQRDASTLFAEVMALLDRLELSRPFLEIEAEVADIACTLHAVYNTENGRKALDAALQFYNQNSAESRTALHALLEQQHYRLTWWRNAADEINWRRFFEISELSGIRVEHEEVFEATHAVIFDLFKEGLIDGLRIDHIDGLANPQQYCRRLRSRLESLVSSRALKLQQSPYLIAEKILVNDEQLVSGWGLEGTTGYDFMEAVNGVMHDPFGEQPLTSLWKKVTKDSQDFEQNVRNARRQLLSENFVGEFEATALALHKIARLDLQTRDYSLASIRRVLTEILMHFPVYRTYVTPPEPPSESDLLVFTYISNKAQRTLSNADKPLLKVLLSWLSGDLVLNLQDNVAAQLSRIAITRFQQLTPPLLAKSVEDTAFYRYGRLLSRNEVGGSPDIFSLSVEAFHQRVIQRQQHYPLSMLATATHDHKRGEDARARLAVLSEVPWKWEHAVQEWLRINAAYHRDIHPNDHLDVIYSAPRPHHAYMFYQTLVGHWPYTLSPDNEEEMAQYSARLNAWFLKSIREAKRFSNWIQTNEEYEEACTAFVTQVLSAENLQFLNSVYAFVNQIAYAGALNSLSMCLLRLTTPGIPDLYQGTELWDFSLVDPDNRRPVDYVLRQAMLNEKQSILARMTDWQNGAIKQWLIHQLLALRNTLPALFKRGDYQPLKIDGPKYEHFIAFARSWQGERIIVVAPRLTTFLQTVEVLGNGRSVSVIDQAVIQQLQLEVNNAEGTFVDVLTQDTYCVKDGKLDLSAMLGTLPFCVLRGMQESG